MYAGPVSKGEAQQKAASFMKSKTGIQRAIKEVPAGVRRAPDQQQAPYYAFNLEGGGFVIVSGDDRTEEILGYSNTGTFDEIRMPSNMRAFLQS